MKRYFLFLSLLFSTVCISAQQLDPNYEAYIEQFYNLALIEQERHKIPASITLAQGLLESNAGRSRLANAGNNHFGIKCSGGWTGDFMYHDDERHDECFRKYATALDSYEDHSLFLKKQRYAFLFDYDITDYKAWANGLRTAGYATDPKYPAKLIKLIEDYQLFRFDTMQVVIDKKEEKKLTPVKEKQPSVTNSDRLFGYVETINNGVKCVRVMDDENTIANLSKELNIPEKNLLYFNDMAEATTLQRGDYVYLWMKRLKAEEKFETHTVEAYESMHSISQLYGIRLKWLYKLNDLEYGTPAKVGLVLKLR